MKKVGVIFGGMSTENEVSLVSGSNIIKNLDKNKYDVYPIYIDKEGIWYKYDTKEVIDNIIEYLKSMDVIFPVLHGLYGEDGTIQGLLELIKVPYVGCKVLASSVCMDKAYAKIIFDKVGLNQTKYVYLKIYDSKNIYVNDALEEEEKSIDEIAKLIEDKMDYPVFIKPSNFGSSIGINKAINREELNKYIKEASKYDIKVLVEEEVKGQEVECAVLGNSLHGVTTSRVGEILAADSFYTYDAKYNNNESKTLIPARVSDDKIEEIRNLAKRAFLAVDGSGLSRVDFFIRENGEVLINEINTLPGFTEISMYPKLMEDIGISYSELLDKLIELV